MLEPPNNLQWQFQNMSANGEWVDIPSVSVEPLEYPKAYCLEYDGDDDTIKNFFTKNDLSGTYNMSSQEEVPYYEKKGTAVRFLLRNDYGRWSVSQYRSDDIFGFMYQDKKNDPAPTENGKWNIPIEYKFIEVSGISLFNCDELSNTWVIRRIKNQKSSRIIP